MKKKTVQEIATDWLCAFRTGTEKPTAKDLRRGGVRETIQNSWEDEIAHSEHLDDVLNAFYRDSQRDGYYKDH